MLQTRNHDFSVLIVEDDTPYRRFLVSLISNEYPQWIVQSVENGSDAILKIEKNEPYNIALIDIGLPDFEGTQLIKRIRSKSPKSFCLVITLIE